MNERAIFEALLDRKDPNKRAAYLNEACGEDQALRAHIEGLLKAHEMLGSFLAPPEAPGPTLVEPLRECPGSLIGPYKLLEQIGEGGFGVVFMAEQQQPVRRKVALKVLKPGMDTRQVVARFEAERQALAIMDHANIARVFDGGETAGGRPYFVMELVKGLPITDYCDHAQLTPRERLELFVHLCQAVQHAHQKGLIHRDLKPSNVLVTLHDGTPLAKVIDFGIAKALGQQLTDKTLFTGFAQMIGTPLYMSPEQAALSNVDVDTRSDIYSLGVLLYELLTGTTPFDKERFKEVGYDELRRAIREEEPPRPSTRISTLGKAATTVATQRKSDPKRLSQVCRGELDWIVMKALEKDRNRRYETASALASDVQRYLHDEPVLACPPSIGYRFRKFARRHKVELAMGGMILLFVALLGSAAGWLVGDRTTRMAALEREANRALEEAGDLQNRAKWTEALEAVKRAEGILASGGNQGVRDRVRERRKDLEMVLRLELIRLPPAVAGMDGRQNDKATDTAYAEAFREYGIDVDTLDPQEAAERIRGRSVLLELASALDHWAGTRRAISQGDDAGWKRLVAVARAADLDEWRNELRDAWEHRRIETLNKLATSAPRKDLPAQTWLLLCLFNGGMSHQVEQALLRQAQHKFPDDYWINFKLAWTLDHSPPPYSQPDEAVRYYTATVAVRPRNLPGRWYLAQALLQRGKFEEAFAEYQMCIEVQKESGGQNGKYHNVLAWHLSNCPDPKLRDPGLAIELATQAVELNRGEGSFWNTLGVAHYRAGHWKQAIAALEKAMPLHRGQHESYDMYFLAMAYWQLDEKEKAREFYDRAVRWMEKNESRNDELRGFRGEAAELLGVKEKKD